ncbi:MAG: substrate-binding domain-containing protein [Anaerolineae bacterium]|jgi:phosphate transport system substrate-binding protein|nr:hypothetical protein [Chloroflexota bacterium]
MMRPGRWFSWISVGLAALAVCLILAGCQSVPASEPVSATEVLPTATPLPPLWLAAGYEAGPLADLLRTSYRRANGVGEVLTEEMSTAAALDALQRGAADVALVAAVSSEALQATLGDARVVPVAVDGVVIIAHPSVNITAISPADLARIYSGDTSDWSALEGGSGRPVLAIQSQGTAARLAFDAAVMEGVAPATTARVLPTDSHMVEYVSTTANSIGYAAACLVRQDSPVTIVAMDRVLPTRANLEKGQYPLAYELYLVTLDSTLPTVEALIRHATSPLGQAAISELYAPAPAP